MAVSDQIAFHESLTVAAAKQQPDLAIWSETAIPIYILHPMNAELFHGIRSMVDSLGINLFTGIADLTYYPENTPPPASSRTSASGRRNDAFNSSMLMSPG